MGVRVLAPDTEAALALLAQYAGDRVSTIDALTFAGVLAQRDGREVLRYGDWVMAVKLMRIWTLALNAPRDVGARGTDLERRWQAGLAAGTLASLPPGTVAAEDAAAQATLDRMLGVHQTARRVSAREWMVAATVLAVMAGILCWATR